MAITSAGDPALIIAWRQGSTLHGRTVKIGGDVAAGLQQFAEACASQLNDDAPLYDPDSPPEDDPQRTAPREEAYDADLLDVLSVGSSHPKADEADYSRRLICWAVVMGTGEDQTIYVHRSSPVQLASKPLIAGLFDDSLARLTDHVLAFDPNFDLVITPEKLYILDHKDFEALFKDSDAVLARSKEWSEKLTTQLPSTEGSAAAVEAILRRNSVMRRKVTSILRRPYFEELKPEILLDRLTQHGMDEEIHFPDGKLNFTEETIVALVRLLNEDLFRGDFSNEQFAASGKQRLSA